MAQLALQRLRNDRWLYLVLLAGWVTATALGASIPSYVDAVHQRLLTLELQSLANSQRPAFGFLFLSLDTESGKSQLGGDPTRRAGVVTLTSYLRERFPSELGLSANAQMHYAHSDLFQLFPAGAGAYGRGDEPLEHMNIGFLSDAETHIAILSGRRPAPPQPTDMHVETLVHRNLANQLGLQAGEDYVLYRAANPNPQTGERAIALPVTVVGIWEAADADSAYWYLSPTSFEETLLTTESGYLNTVSARIPRPFFEAGWYASLDGGKVRAQSVQNLQRRILQSQNQVQQRLPGTHLMLSPEDALWRYRAHVARQSPLILIMGLPVLGLLLLFVAMSAQSLMTRQKVEIATLRSRGASRTQVLSSYAVLCLALSVASLALGLPCGLLAAKQMAPAALWLLGGDAAGNGIELSPVLTRDSLVYAGCVLLLVNVAALGSAWTSARTTLVAAERHMTRGLRLRPTGQIALELTIAAAGAYGWYLLRAEGAFARPEMFKGVEFYDNPLLFLTPCLWLWTGGRGASLLLPWLCRGLDLPVRSLPGTALLMAVRNLARQAPQHQALLSLLLLTTGLGALVTSVMRTQDDNLQARAYYAVGSTVAVTERAKRFSQREGEPASDSRPAGWSIPPFELHRQAQGVLGAARVGVFPVSLTVGGRSFDAALYGIDREEWPEAGYFREDFSPHSLGELMNRLALVPEGLLVPSHVLTESGYSVGDPLQIRGLVAGSGATVPFRIVGTLHFFPTAYPPEELFAVGNLEYIFRQVGGPLPYHVWLRVADDANENSVRAELEERSIEVLRLEDARTLLARWRTDPARLGAYGFLVMGTAACLILSLLALAVHAVLTMQRRRVQLAVLRALGWTRRQTGACLAMEELALVTLGIAGGTGLGFGVSRQFIPLMQSGSRAQDVIPPYVVRHSWSEPLAVFVGLLGAIALLTVLLNAILSRTRLFEVLKMGELQG